MSATCERKGKTAQRWVTLIADGRPLAIMIENGYTHEKERKRLAGLAGIEFVPSTDQHRKKFKSTIEAAGKGKKENPPAFVWAPTVTRRATDFNHQGGAIGYTNQGG